MNPEVLPGTYSPSENWKGLAARLMSSQKQLDPAAPPPGEVLTLRLPAQPSTARPALGSTQAPTRKDSLQAAVSLALWASFKPFPYPHSCPPGPGWTRTLGNIQASSSLQAYAPSITRAAVAPPRPPGTASHPTSSRHQSRSRWASMEAPAPPFPAREDELPTKAPGCWEGRPVGS